MRWPDPVRTPHKLASLLLGLAGCTGVLADPSADPQQLTGDGIYVFATRAVYGGGELHGVDGADLLCASAATRAQLPSVEGRGAVPGAAYHAWLSSVERDLTGRFKPSARPYKLVDGTAIAGSWSELTDGTLAHAIDLDEYGVQIIDRDDLVIGGAWTFTQADATAVPWTDRDSPTASPRQDCDAWTSGAGVGAVGMLHEVSAAWTYADLAVGCSYPHHLYCFGE